MKQTNQSRTVVWLEHLGWPPKSVLLLIVHTSRIIAFALSSVAEKCPNIQLNWSSSFEMCNTFSCKHAIDEAPFSSLVCTSSFLCTPTVISHIHTLCCRSGVSRTGPFLSLFTCLHDVEEGRSFPDLNKIIRLLRSKRRHIIQDMNQLKFVYEALLFYLQDLLVKRNISLFFFFFFYRHIPLLCLSFSRLQVVFSTRLRWCISHQLFRRNHLASRPTLFVSTMSCRSSWIKRNHRCHRHPTMMSVRFFHRHRRWPWSKTTNQPPNSSVRSKRTSICVQKKVTFDRKQRATTSFDLNHHQSKISPIHSTNWILSGRFVDSEEH